MHVTVKAMLAAAIGSTLSRDVMASAPSANMICMANAATCKTSKQLRQKDRLEKMQTKFSLTLVQHLQHVLLAILELGGRPQPQHCRLQKRFPKSDR